MKASQINENYKVVFCIGANYWKHLAVAIFSVVEHTKSLDIFVFYESDNKLWRSKILRLVERAKCHISFVPFDSRLVNGLKKCEGHIGPSTYYRLFIPELLDSNIDKILYLDSDILLRGSVCGLFEVPLNGKIIAARPVYWIDARRELNIRLKRSNDSPYFNAGIMIIDLIRWRNEHITERTVSFIQRYPEQITHPDQCALNHVIGCSFEFLSPMWNVTMAYWETTVSSKIAHINYADLVEARENPMIIHFNGPSKPWHWANRHPWKSSYVGIRRCVQKLPYVSDDLGSAFVTYLERNATRAIGFFRKVARYLFRK